MARPLLALLVAVAACSASSPSTSPTPAPDGVTSTTSSTSSTSSTSTTSSTSATSTTSTTSTSTSSTITTTTTTTTEVAAVGSCRGGGWTERLDEAYRTLDGVDPATVSVDVYVPTRAAGCAAAPVVVWVHGGGFRHGDKANQLADKIELFTSAGWVLVSVNYRLVDDPRSGPGFVAYPAQADDVATAVRWVTDHATELDADPTRVALLGHSAGAFLVAQLGTDPIHLTDADVDPASVRCVAPLDTETFAIADHMGTPGLHERMYRAAFGDDPVGWAQASPQTGAVAGTVTADFLLVTRGAPDRYAGNERFAEALTAAAGVAADVVDAAPVDHAGVNTAVGAPGDTIVTPPLMAFLTACL